MASVDDPLSRILPRLETVKQNGSGYTARCPVPGCPYRVSIKAGDDGRALVFCQGGHGAADVCSALGVPLSALFPARGTGTGEGETPANTSATAQHPGLTLAQYAEAKKLDVERLRAWGVSDCTFDGRAAIRLAFFDPVNIEVSARFRLRLDKGKDDDRFRWKKGSKAVPYGQNRLLIARERGFVCLVEGESDCHTLWQHGEPALGIPGAGCWKDERDAALLDDIETIYVVREPDAGGDSFVKRFSASPLRKRIRVVTLTEHKDPSDLHLANPSAFLARWQAAKEAAVQLDDLVAEQAKAEADAAWIACQRLAEEPDILDRAARTVAALGVAGEVAAVKLLFLALVSRLLDRPVSVALKGPSSAGKSYIVEQVLRLFPPEAFYCLTAMSERALAYSAEPLRHRTLVIFEAAGLSGDMASYLIRSLLSEGRLDYETVEKTKDGLKARRITREGPTGLIVTTTAVSLHPENETRLLSVPVSDTQEQTRAVLAALANGHGETPDLAVWHELQRWLAGGPNAVSIPYAGALAALTPPKAVRLRRDFGAVLTLIRAHALLHRASRDLDAAGAIVAMLDDYAAVRALVEPLIAAGVGATVPATMRETVEAVADLLDGKGEEVTVSITKIAAALDLDKAPTSRRVRAAIERGFLVNHEDRQGRPSKIALGGPLPEDSPILPTPGVVANRCAVAPLIEEDQRSPSPEADDWAGGEEAIL
jgi:hypothetical protein